MEDEFCNYQPDYLLPGLFFFHYCIHLENSSAALLPAHSVTKLLPLLLKPLPSLLYISQYTGIWLFLSFFCFPNHFLPYFHLFYDLLFSVFSFLFLFSFLSYIIWLISLANKPRHSFLCTLALFTLFFYEKSI